MRQQTRDVAMCNSDRRRGSRAARGILAAYRRPSIIRTSLEAARGLALDAPKLRPARLPALEKWCKNGMTNRQSRESQKRRRTCFSFCPDRLSPPSVNHASGGEGTRVALKALI